MKRITKRIWSVLITCSLACSMILAAPGELQSMGEVKAATYTVGQQWTWGSGQTGTFTVPVTGFYDFFVKGGSGNGGNTNGCDYATSQAGESGGFMTGRVKLTKGSVLTINTGITGGGQDGSSAYNSTHKITMTGGKNGTQSKVTMDGTLLISAAGGAGGSAYHTCNRCEDEPATWGYGHAGEGANYRAMEYGWTGINIYYTSSEPVVAIYYAEMAKTELKDCTTFDGNSASFDAYLADAASYCWYYNDGTDWQEIGIITGSDPSVEIEKGGRYFKLEMKYSEEWKENISVLTLKSADINSDDGLQIRCVAEGDTTLDTTASLKVLKNGYQEIMASYHKQLEAGTEIKIEDVLVALLYESGSPTFASGWSNLYFLEEDEEGNEQEVKTVRVEQGENVYRVRLKDMNPDPTDTTKETTFQVTGVDTIAPIMESVAVSPYSVRNEDASEEPEVITVTLDGSDNYTPADKLLYAIKLQGEELVEGDFSSQQEYELSIPDNSVYVAYIKDLAGNITSQEVSILLRDADDPMIVSATLVFPAEDGWVNKNIIEVEATDNYMPEHLTYRFTPPAGVEFDQEDEENCFGIWITESRCIIESNGVYQIEVMDSVGNITSTEINVTNIDQNKPEIENIEIQAIS